MFVAAASGTCAVIASLETVVYETIGSIVAAELEKVETLADVVVAYSAHDALIVGTLTWNTGADVTRHGMS
jgi:hypothetical protein